MAVLLTLLLLSLLSARAAIAAGGRYVLVGGTAGEQAQVRRALDASAFDWSLVSTQVTIHIVHGLALSYSTPGDSWLDAGLLDSGRFSWGVVQMEYGQQVQYAIQDAQERAELTIALGARQWCYDDPALPAGVNACERFAATLAWAYWPSNDNAMKPTGTGDWSASIDPTDFRALLARLLGAPDTIDGPRNLAGLASDATRLTRVRCRPGLHRPQYVCPLPHDEAGRSGEIRRPPRLVQRTSPARTTSSTVKWPRRSDRLVASGRCATQAG